MSQVTRTSPQQQQPPSETITKKKLGKNLNRLTRPPSPPSAPTAKVNTASKNGLLLLSTKRTATGGNVASSSGGILSNKSANALAKPLPSLGLQYESNTSTHDALLGAVVGASRAEAQHQPDAWGVADKSNRAGNLNTDGSAASGNQTQQLVQNGNHGHNDARAGVAASTNWDEYGGRKDPRDWQGTGQDPQREIKSRELWGGDDLCQGNQRAAPPAGGPDIENPRNQNRKSEHTSAPIHETAGSQKPTLVLEKLNRSRSLPEDNSLRSPIAKDEKNNPRTLYDPNGSKPYSSLWGGAGSKDEKESNLSSPDHSRNGRPRAGSYSPEPPLNDARDPKYNRQPVIQLSSYETRDRGASSGPRMLFDPKSGSMVAVPSRDESGAAARGRKDRGKKGRRDKDSKADTKVEAIESSKSTRKAKQKRDDASQRGRGGDPAGSPSKAETKKGRSTGARRLPRTRGVLYARDNKGSIYSVDACDGDLGYGAHSVPGGRAKNPDAYARFTDQQKQVPKDDADFYLGHSMDTCYEKETVDQDMNQYVALQTGFSLQEPVKIDWVKPNEKISLVTGVDDSPTLQATAKEWAPSEAALAAAAAAFEREKGVLSSPVQLHGENDDDDDAPFGLGFDPTLNMDAVIQSPSSEPATGFDAVNLTALSLEPSALKSTAKSNHIFAFESGATWGASNTGGGNDWGMPPTGKAFSNDEQSTSAMPSTFLSLSSGGTWGGVPGLGGTSVRNTQLGREHNRPNGE